MHIITRYILPFIGFMAVQVLFNDFTLYDMATPYVFLLFLLMLPLQMNFALTLVIAFSTGLVADILTDANLTGMHAFSAVLMMSVRNTWVRIISTKTSFSGIEEMQVETQPVYWQVNYLLPLIFIHHVMYYMMEAFSFRNFGETLIKISLSTIYTFIFCLIFTLLFYKKSNR